MINHARLQELLLAYDEEVKLFFYAYGLADLVVDKALDHVAVKGLDSVKYQEYLKEFAPYCKRLSYEPVGPRDLAIGELKEPLDGGTLGLVSTLEIMEPKPDTIPTTHDLIDHIEILVDDLATVKSALESKNVEFKEQSNDKHTAIVVEINEWGQEVKFTDRTLQSIAEEQIAAGTAKIYSPNN